MEGSRHPASFALVSVSAPRPTIEHMIEALAAASTSDIAIPADPTTPPLEWLETQICELAGHLTAATCRFLALLGDFDERRGWAEWDLPSCAAWLSWKCQLTSGTAREHVRVARALRTLPALSAEFAAGRMSFAKIRALTRIATPATQSGLAELAGPMTASQLERFARAHRTVSRADDGCAAVVRRLTWRQEDDGSLAMTVRLPPADGTVVLQALRAAPCGPLPMPRRGRHCYQPRRSPADLLLRHRQLDAARCLRIRAGRRPQIATLPTAFRNTPRRRARAGPAGT
jgi:Domain of unknown function (DUF222)